MTVKWNKTARACFWMIALSMAWSAAKAQFVPVGRAQQLGDNCWMLTDTVNLNNDADTAAIWWPNTVNLNSGFDISFQVSVLSPAGGPFFAGDGMAFVLQNAGTAAMGPGANSLGYAHQFDGITCGAPYNGGIDPSVAVELDLFHNGVCIADPAGGYDHLAVVENGRYNIAFPAVPPPAFSNPGLDVAYAPTATPTCYVMRIRYMNDSLYVFFNNDLRIIRANYNIANTIFGGNPNVYWGITAGTGAFAGRFTICYDNADAGTDTLTCANQPVQLGAVGGGTYAWSPGTGLSNPNSGTPTFTPSGPGSFTYVCSTTTTYGCMDRDTMVITVAGVPLADAGPDVAICSGQSVQLGIPQGNPNWVASWTPPTGLNNPNIFTPTASPTTTTTYTLVVVDTSSSAMCADTSSVTVTVTNTFVVDAGPNDTICLGDTALIGLPGQPGFSYSWTPSSSLLNPNGPVTPAFPSNTTAYFLTVIDTTTSAGCSGTDTVIVLVNDVDVILTGDPSICNGEVDELVAIISGGSGDYDIVWNSSPASSVVDSTNDTLYLSPSADITYFVNVTDNVWGCSDSSNFFVEVNELAITLTADRDTINPDQPVWLTASGGMAYVWSDSIIGLNCYDCPNPIALALNGRTSWTVTGIDTITGCIGTATISLVVKPYQVPNVFTPNGDGINDVLDLGYFGTVDNMKDAQIYDRWGHLMYFTTNRRVLWDGRTKGGSDAPEGVYFLVVKIVADNTIPGPEKNQVFPVTLLR